MEVPVLAFVVALTSIVLAQHCAHELGYRALTLKAQGGLPDHGSLLKFGRMLLLALPLVGGLLAIRWIPHRGWALLVATLFVFGGIGGVVAQQFSATAEFDSLWGETDRILITTLSSTVLRLAVALGAILAALAGYALVPRWWAFLLGGIVGGQVILLLGSARMDFPHLNELGTTLRVRAWQDVVLAFLTNAVLVGTLWILPQQRRALLRAAGLAEEDTSAPRRLVLRCAFTSLTVALLLMVGTLARIEEKTLGVLLAPQPMPRSPALVNAWEAMAERFERPEKNQQPRHVFPKLFATPGLNRQKVLSEPSLEVTRGIATESLRAGMAQEEVLLTPWVRDFVAAGRADYLQPVGGGSVRLPNFLALRETTRWLSLRARLRCVDGDWRGALADTEAILRFSALEVDGPLVMHMIQVAIRGIGTRTGAVYWQAFRNDVEAMRALATVLDSTPGNRRSFPIDALRRFEPGFGPIVPMAELATPSFLRATTIYQRNAGDFDLLRVAVALELFRHERGDYPEQLDQLVPDFLPVTPRDAYDGKPLIYKVTEEALLLDAERNSKRSDPLTRPVRFAFTFQEE